MHLVILPIIIWVFLLPNIHFLGILLVKLMIRSVDAINRIRIKTGSYDLLRRERVHIHVHEHPPPPPSANLLIINVYNQNT